MRNVWHFVIDVWSEIILAGSDNPDSLDIKRRVCIGVNLICVSIIFLLFLICTIFFFMVGSETILLYEAIEGFLMAFITWLNFERKYELANVLLYLVVNVTILYFGAALQNFAMVQLSVVFIIGLIYFLFEGFEIRVMGIFTTALLLLLVNLNSKYEFVHPITFDNQLNHYIGWTVYFTLICLISLIFFLHSTNATLVTKVKSLLNKKEDIIRFKSSLLETSAHELKNMLPGIIEITKICNQEIEVIKAHYEHDFLELTTSIGHLTAASINLKGLMDNIIEQAKDEAGVSQNDVYFEAINLQELLKQIIEISLYKASDKKVAIELHMAGEIPELISSNGLKLAMIVTNLLDNAIKFTKSGSVVQVVVNQASPGFMNLIISDEGPGISNERMKTLFERFRTHINSGNRQGVGLGLSIAKLMVEHLNGKIAVETSEIIGTTFTVTLPLIKSAKSNKIDQLDIKHLTEPLHLNVLLADDQPIASIVIREQLKSMGCLVTESRSGDELLQVARNSIPDIIIVDYQMPKMSGIETAQCLRDDDFLRQIPIIITTGFCSDTFLESVKKLPGIKYLEKPIEDKLLYDTINYLTSNRGAMNP